MTTKDITLEIHLPDGTTQTLPPPGQQLVRFSVLTTDDEKDD
jgi:hypothetical protein